MNRPSEQSSAPPLFGVRPVKCVGRFEYYDDGGAVLCDMQRGLCADVDTSGTPTLAVLMLSLWSRARMRISYVGF